MKKLDNKIDTTVVVAHLLEAMRYVGLHPSKEDGKLYIILSFLLIFIFTACYPVAMLLDLIFSNNTGDLFVKGSTTLTSVMASIKVFNAIYQRNHLDRIHEILSDLDERARTVANADEKLYLWKADKLARRALAVFASLYTIVATVCILSQFFAKKPLCSVVSCKSPWLPLSWKQSRAFYYTIFAYQLIGIPILSSQNLLNDVWPGICLMLLKGHVRALNIRVSKIGHQLPAHHIIARQELVKCIKDHKKILQCCDEFQHAFGGVLFIQLFITELTLCIIAVCFRYIRNKTELIFSGAYFLSMLGEIYLPCYCGNEIFYETELILGALFSCNWMEQDTKFKRTLIIAMQRCQKPVEIYAGGILKVSLSTLLAVLKAAYSLFAIADQLH